MSNQVDTMNQKCRNCGRPAFAHYLTDQHNPNGLCPKMGPHVVIDADSMDRVQRTGHPRLLKNLLAGKTGDLFKDVTTTVVVVEK